mmetsp:Transcript_26618/g.44574  ORF Transcript_26618/g.44574 Transcript_26618/m.44574 type:complete len:312 (-) Transcript_26618:122-1057(-)
MVLTNAFACNTSASIGLQTRPSLEVKYDKKSCLLPARAHFARNTVGLRLQACHSNPSRMASVLTAAIVERVEDFEDLAEEFETFEKLKEFEKFEKFETLAEDGVCHGVCCISQGPYGKPRVPVYDSSREQYVWADISGRRTPHHVGFAGAQLWTLDLRLATNGVKIGDLVAQASPSAEADQIVLTVCSVLNYDTTRFRGVGTALVSHMVHGDWMDGKGLKIHQIVAENVRSDTAFFWYSLGFRFSKGAEDWDYFTPSSALNQEIQDILEECDECIVDTATCTVYDDLKACMIGNSYRLTGDQHEMSCKFEC